MNGIYTNLRGLQWHVTIENWDGNRMLIRFRDGFTMHTHVTRVQLICVSVLEEILNKYRKAVT